MLPKNFTNLDFLRLMVKNIPDRLLKKEITRLKQVNPNLPDDRLADITVGEWLTCLTEESNLRRRTS